MKILIDGRFWGLENAGLGRYTINLVKSLAKLDKKNRYVILLRKKYFRKLKLPKNWEKILGEFRHYTLREQMQLPKIIAKINPDISHFPHFNIPVTFRGKFVVTIHDILWHKQKGMSVTTLPTHIYMVKYLGYKLVFSKAVKKSQKIIVPSQAVKKELLGYYKSTKEDKIVVTYEGVDRKFFSKKSVVLPKKYGLSKPYFIYAGNAYPHKNLPRAMEAVIRLNKLSRDKVLFVIACSRDIFLEKLKKAVYESGAQRYIKIIGFVSDEDLGILYKNSLALLYPSFSEGFGLQGLEAIAAGTLTCVSDISVFKEVYKDNAVYFDPGSVASILKSLKKILDMDTKIREKTIKKSQKFIKKYSWDKMAEETLKIYKQSLLLRKKQSLLLRKKQSLLLRKKQSLQDAINSVK